MRLATRLVGASVASVLILLGVGGMGIYSVMTLAGKFQQASADNGRILKIVQTGRSAQVEFKKQVQAWKDTLLRGKDPAAYEKHLKEFAAEELAASEALQTTRECFRTANIDTADVDAALAAHAALGTKYRAALEANPDHSAAGWSSQVDVAVKGIDRPLNAALDRILQTIADMAGKTSADVEAARFASLSRNVTIAGTLLGAVVALTLSTLTSRWASKTLRRIADTLSEASRQTALGAQEISKTAQGLAAGASKQAAGLEESTSALTEISSMTSKAAETARQASSMAVHTRTSADTGNTSMTQMNDAILTIEKSAAETAKILKVIDEIAFQTNLLALNAAVEAARAGEAGKGFAVVAQEVRNLAMRSAEAAKTTATLIETSVTNARSGVKIVTAVAGGFGEIRGSATKVSDLVAEISASNAELARGVDQISASLAQMDTVTQANAAGAEESAAASEELSSQASALTGLVGDLQELVTGKR